MVFPFREDGNWILDYNGLIEVTDGSFCNSSAAFNCPMQTLNASSNVSRLVLLVLPCLELLSLRHVFNSPVLKLMVHLLLLKILRRKIQKRGLLVDKVIRFESWGFPCYHERGRTESRTLSSSKACREKMRRDRLNDKFMELGYILEQGGLPKTDKAAILVDAIKKVTQLRTEVQKLKESNFSLQDSIKESKAEKIELRDEKQRLKVEKEKLENELKTTNTHPGFLPPYQAAALAAAFDPQHPSAGGKMVPYLSYPGVSMWQFMRPAQVDTSQDHALRPPVA